MFNTISGCVGRNGHKLALLRQMYQSDFLQKFRLCQFEYVLDKMQKKIGRSPGLLRSGRAQ